MGPYLLDGGENIFEFIGVIIHRGNPYGGHYYLVCKD